MRQGIRMAIKGHTDPTLDAADEATRRERMTTIRVPRDVVVSPQDGSQVKFDTGTRLFTDGAGTAYSVDELASARPGNRIRVWVDENYPETSTK